MTKKTKPITAFDRINLRKVIEEVEAAVKAVGERYGISITRGSANFDATAATVKLEMVVLAAVNSKQGDNPTVVKARRAWKQQAKAWCFVPERLGHLITYEGEQYRIEGLLPRRHRYPVLAIHLSTGKMIALPPRVAMDIKTEASDSDTETHATEEA